MSINSEISNYTTYLTNAYTKCSSKNATIPANKNLQNLTACINSIPRHNIKNYIESTGTQYIDTGFIPKPTTKVEMQFRIVTDVNQMGFFGTYGTLVFLTYRNGSGKYAFSYQNDTGNSISTGVAVNTTADHKIIFNGKSKKYQIDNSAFALTSYTATNDGSQNMYLFAYHTASDTAGGKISMKLYYCKIYDDDTLVRDYIPVIHYGIPCLYDKVNKDYTYNAGTGEFLFG